MPHCHWPPPLLLQTPGTLSVAAVARQARHSSLSCHGDGGGVVVEGGGVGDEAVVGRNDVIVWAAAKCVPRTSIISRLIETIYHTI